MTDRDTIQSALRGLIDAFNSHDLNRIMEFFAEDCVLEMPRGPEPFGSRSVGHEAVRKGLASRFEGLPDVRYSDDSPCMKLLRFEIYRVTSALRPLPPFQSNRPCFCIHRPCSNNKVDIL